MSPRPAGVAPLHPVPFLLWYKEISNYVSVTPAAGPGPPVGQGV